MTSKRFENIAAPSSALRRPTPGVAIPGHQAGSSPMPQEPQAMSSMKTMLPMKTMPVHIVDAPWRLRHLVAENNNRKGGVVQRLRCCLVLVGLLSVPTLAMAQSRPAYTAGQIIERFSGAAAPQLGPARGLGTERKVCIGTEADCRGGPTAPPTIASANAPSFDLMIQFGLDSDRLTDGARRNLDEFAQALQDPRLKVKSFAVEGHTDARGSDDHNLDLSRRRAEAVVRYLESRGITRERVQPMAFGSGRPRTNDPFDPTNRRVETRLAQ